MATVDRDRWMNGLVEVIVTGSNLNENLDPSVSLHKKSQPHLLRNLEQDSSEYVLQYLLKSTILHCVIPLHY